MADVNGKLTALYCRLSVEDRNAGDSNSIVNQREYLGRYAKEHNFQNCKYYVDDGLSGTVFRRPGLDAMLADIKAGNVAVVIIKDQSRIGRDVLEVGLLKRTFEDYGVRYIAAADNLDSNNGFDIMSLFRDVINEYYVQEISAKIRVVKRTNALAGKLTSRLSYGYKVSPANLAEWFIDEEAAEIVREIFKRFHAGEIISEIGRALILRGVPAPGAYQGYCPNSQWSVTTIAAILDNTAYIGTYNAQRQTTPSYKNHKRFTRPESEWVTIKKHHPAIIDDDTFAAVARLRQTRRRVTKIGHKTILGGLIFCSDCHNTLSWANEGSKNLIPYYICSTNRHNGIFNERKCSRHSIRAEVLEKIVLNKIQEVTSLARSNPAAFAARVQQLSNKDAEREVKKKTLEIDKAERRVNDLDKLITNTHESHVLGTLSEERFKKMLGGYENEQTALIETVRRLKAELNDLKSKTANLQSFMNLVERYGEITELTTELVRTFIERIVVHEAVIAENFKKKRLSQEVEVYFTFIGQFEAETPKGN